MGILGVSDRGRFGRVSGAISMLALTLLLMPKTEARTHHKSKHISSSQHSSKSSGTATSGRHHGRHHERATHHKIVASKPRYAYPVDIFMNRPPEFDQSPLASETAQRVRTAFNSGVADSYPPGYLIRAGVVNFYSLRGGIFRRREPVKYVIVHSTETGVPQDARHVIDSWSGMGKRHPGAQYVVDRDGTIYECCDPELATVHVNIFKTLPGINNDNSVGIEMCHAGSQTYPPEQRAAVTKLVSYLQDRFHVLNENVVTHRYAQQGDHTDPVNFDFDAFLATKDNFHNQALAMKHSSGPEEIVENDLPVASVYLEMHKALRPQDVMQRRTYTTREIQSAEQRVDAYFQQHEIKPNRGAVTIEPSTENDLQESVNRGTALSVRTPKGGAALRSEMELAPSTAKPSQNEQPE